MYQSLTIGTNFRIEARQVFSNPFLAEFVRGGIVQTALMSSFIQKCFVLVIEMGERTLVRNLKIKPILDQCLLILVHLGQGDSGGPLMHEKNNRWFLIGIVSAGYSCASRGQPGIYHRVAHTVDWISHIINPT